MKLRRVLHALVCLLALGYLLVANARGYDPFATPTGRGNAMGTANHFHK